jgi:hypothetical protein
MVTPATRAAFEDRIHSVELLLVDVVLSEKAVLVFAVA